MRVLLDRRAAIDASRRNWRAWRPWLARMNTIQALLAADEARALCPVRDASPTRPGSPPSRPRSPPSMPNSPPRSPHFGDSPAQPVPPPPPAHAASDPAYAAAVLRTLTHFARAAQLASWDTEAAHELLGAVHLMWNGLQALVNADEALLHPLEAARWQLKAVTMEIAIEAPEQDITDETGPSESKTATAKVRVLLFLDFS